MRLTTILAFMLLSQFFGVAICAPLDPQTRYDRVEIGMTSQEVERYFGPMVQTSLTFEPGEFVFLFEDDKLYSKFRTVQPEESVGPHTEQVWHVQTGMSRAEVIAIMGPPTTDCTTYQLADSPKYEFCFKERELVSKHIVPRVYTPLPPHGACDQMFFFDIKSTALPPRAQEYLTAFVANCPPIAGRSVFVVGHTDGTESPQESMALSRARAEIVRAYLVSKGVKADLIQVYAYGDTKPLVSAPPGDESADRQNRRVQVGLFFTPHP